MTDLQALVTGYIAARLVDGILDIEVQAHTDGAGNYLPRLTVIGRQTGARVVIEVTPA